MVAIDVDLSSVWFFQIAFHTYVTSLVYNVIVLVNVAVFITTQKVMEKIMKKIWI